MSAPPVPGRPGPNTKAGANAAARITAQSTTKAAAKTRAETGSAVVREEQMTELGVAFRNVFRSLSRLRGRDTHLAGGELSHAQFELLIELHERGDLAAGELAAAARLTPGTVTQMLDHLADCGHVERVRSETDRRVVVSRLTSQGRRKIEAKRAAWKGRWDDALADVEIAELQAATRVLERLGAMVEDAPPQTGLQAPEQPPGAAQN